MKERRYDIDWVRVVATLTVFIFHSGRFFDKLDWHLKNAEQSFYLTLFVGWLDLWMMPLLFLLSGLGAWYSLQFRSSGQYLLERVKRLLIPLYTVGAFLLLPPQFYFELITHGEDVSSIWNLIPPLSGGQLRFSLGAPYLINLWSGHLWFLQFLFIVSILVLPLLLYLKTEPGQLLIARLARWSSHRGGIFLFLIPLILVRIGLRGLFHGAHTWADLFYFAILFLIGYVIAADRRFTESYKRHGWAFLALGIAAYAAEGAFIVGLQYPYPGAESFSWTYVIFNIVISIGNFCWVMFILSLAARHLNFKHKVLTYGNQAVLPFYIFHQTIILCVGWFVIRWDMGIGPKYLIIASVSFALIMALYDLLVKRFNMMRFFFGMRPKKKPLKTPDARPAGSSS